jgi:hypothetical protein
MGVYIKCGYDQRKTAMYISEKTDISMNKAEKIVFNFYIDFGNDKYYVNEYKEAVYIIEPNNRDLFQNKKTAVGSVIFSVFIFLLIFFVLVIPDIRYAILECASSAITDIRIMMDDETIIKEKYDKAYIVYYFDMVGPSYFFVPMREITDEFEFTGEYKEDLPVFKYKEEYNNIQDYRNIIGYDWAGNPIYEYSDSIENKIPSFKDIVIPSKNQTNTQSPWD